MNKAVDVKSILILDDSEDFRKLLKTILGKYFQGAEFHEYDPVAKGAPADDFNWGAYDVLILDYFLCLHKVTGLDLLQKHRKKPGFPATIMLTGAGNEGVAVRALNFGVHEYLRKDKLDKARLAAAIINAHKKHEIERNQQSEQEQEKTAFDKSLFYRQLEQSGGAGRNGPGRVFLLVDVDNFNPLATRLGAIVSDNLVRHIARVSYESTRTKQGNPCITRFSDSSVGLLVDYPGDMQKLKSDLDGLCLQLAKQPFRHGADFYPCTVSIGAIHLVHENNDIKTLVQKINLARDLARKHTGNSFHIIDDSAKEAGESGATLVAEDLQPEAEKQEVSTGFQPPASVETEIEMEETGMDAPVLTDSVAQEHTESVKSEPSGQGLDQASQAVASETLRPPAVMDKKDEPGDSSMKTEDEIALDESILDNDSLRIKKALDDNRAVQIFQPLIAMFTASSGGSSELFRVDIQIVDVDGSITSARDLRSYLNSLPLQQFIDRWMLRELIGRIVRGGQGKEKKNYLLPISEAWFADITLFGWLKKLLAGLETIKPGHSIIFEISAAAFARHEERAIILVSTLKKMYGFQIALGGVADADEAVKLSKTVDLDLIILEYGTVSQAPKTAGEVLPRMKAQGTHIVMNGVENATILTDAISAGADYVMGNFIGEPQSHPQGVSNVESFEIS